MSTPANAAFKQAQRKFRDRANSVNAVYPQGPKGAQGNRPARRVERDGRVSYVPL